MFRIAFCSCAAMNSSCRHVHSSDVPTAPHQRRRTKKGQHLEVLPFSFGAGEESRTLDLNLGKV
ncbi:MAG TPA: hypothetical protein VGE70_11840, partial [Burkholderiaceae bacterium]